MKFTHFDADFATIAAGITANFLYDVLCVILRKLRRAKKRSKK